MPVLDEAGFRALLAGELTAESGEAAEAEPAGVDAAAEAAADADEEIA